MVIRTGWEAQVRIQERLKEGIIPKAEEHQYVGLWINSEGNLDFHIKELQTKDFKTSTFIPVKDKITTQK